MKTVTSTKSAVTTKPETVPKTERTKKAEPDVRVVKSGVCPSLSGRSKLTYDFGCTEKGDMQLRIVGNTGNGSFRQDWVVLSAIKAALDKAPRNETVTSDPLLPLFRQESANMPSFVFAVLLHEGLVRRSVKEKRRYDRVEPGAFDAAVQALLEGKGATAVDAKSKKVKTTKVVAAKTPSASKKK